MRYLPDSDNGVANQNDENDEGLDESGHLLVLVLLEERKDLVDTSCHT